MVTELPSHTIVMSISSDFTSLESSKQRKDVNCQSQNIIISSYFTNVNLCLLGHKTHFSAVDLNKKDTNIKDSHEEVRDDSYTVSFPFFGFCSCPVESIQDVLTKGGEEAICYLTEEGQVNLIN